MIYICSPPVFSGVRVTRSLVLCVCFVDSCLSFWPLCCLFFFDIQILITPLVSSNSSYHVNYIVSSTPCYRLESITIIIIYMSCMYRKAADTYVKESNIPVIIYFFVTMPPIYHCIPHPICGTYNYYKDKSYWPSFSHLKESSILTLYIIVKLCIKNS